MFTLIFCLIVFFTLIGLWASIESELILLVYMILVVLLMIFCALWRIIKILKKEACNLTLFAFRLNQRKKGGHRS